MITVTTITGHLAMSQIVTAVLPSPNSFPTCSASGPLTTTAIALRATSRMRSSVIASCKGRSFQNGLPSSTS